MALHDLPTSTISNLDNIFITTPRSGTLKSAYGAFKNLQKDTGKSFYNKRLADTLRKKC